jgi:hypothetical protein
MLSIDHKSLTGVQSEKEKKKKRKKEKKKKDRQSKVDASQRFE